MGACGKGQVYKVLPPGLSTRTIRRPAHHSSVRSSRRCGTCTPLMFCGTHAPMPTGILQRLYGHSLALLTDLYQLTMAYGYWKLGAAAEQRGGASTCPSASTRSTAASPSPAACTPRSTTSRALRFDDDDLAYLATLDGQRRQAALRAGVPRLPARPAVHLRRRRHPRGHGRLPARAAACASRGPILQAQLLETALLNMRQLPDADRHQGGARLPGRARRAGARVRPAPRAGHRRRRSPPAAPRTSAGAPRRPTCSPASSSASRSRGTHAHSWVMSLRRRARGVRRLRRGACPTTASSSSTPTTRSRACASAIEVGSRLRARGPRDGRHPARLRRPRVPQHRGAQDPRRGRLPQGRDRREQRPRRAPHRQPEGAGRDDRPSGASARSSSPPTTSPRSAASTSSPRSATRRRRLAVQDQALRAGGQDLEPRHPPGPPLPTRDGEFVADAIYDEPTGIGDGQPRRSSTPSTSPAARRSRPARRTRTCSCPIFRGGKLVYDAPPLDARPRTPHDAARRLPRRRQALRQPAPVPRRAWSSACTICRRS